MKSRKVLFGLMLALLLCLCASIAVAATNVSSYDDLLTAITAGEKEINITSSFTVDKELPLALMDNRPTLASGTVINGNGHTIYLKTLKNYGNGGELFKTNTNCLITNLTFDASGLEECDGNPRILDLYQGTTLIKVNFKGNAKLKYFVCASGKEGTVTFDECTFDNVTGHAIYTDDEGNPATLSVNESTFTNCPYVTIARNDNSVFTNNIIDNANLNAYASDITITNNTFTGKSRIKFYKEDSAKDFSGNYINDESYIENADAAKNTDLSNNIYENIYTALASDTISDNAKAAAIAAHIARNQPAELKNRTPQTGDNSNIALWISLMAISALSFVALGRKSRFN